MHWRIPDPLSKPLMGSGLMKVPNIAHEKPGELLLIEDQKMIQTFPPHTSRDARSHTAFASGVRYGVRSTLMPLVAATRAKCCPNVRSLSRIRYVGPSPYGVASRNCCATQGSVGARVTLTWIRLARCAARVLKKACERTKEEIAHLQAHRRPTRLLHGCPGMFSRSEPFCPAAPGEADPSFCIPVA